MYTGEGTVVARGRGGTLCFTRWAFDTKIDEGIVENDGMAAIVLQKPIPGVAIAVFNDRTGNTFDSYRMSFGFKPDCNSRITRLVVSLVFLKGPSTAPSVQVLERLF